jgi:hypothetical protein
MKKITSIYLILLSVILGGCASSTLYTPSKTVVNFPAVGMVYEAEIGQTLASKANLQVYPAILVTNEVSEKFKATAIGSMQYFNIPSGKLVKIAEDDKGSYYKSSNGYYRVGDEGSFGTISLGVGVFIPNNNPSAAVPVGISGDNGHYSYSLGKSIVKYEKTTGVEKWTEDGFKRELLYSGLSQKTISLSYREFSGGIARPAFSQELKYDLNDGNEIGYKGSRFEIIKATNLKIQYRMIKPLD